jgi:hypothetical protein
VAYRHGEDADFEAELALDRRISDYVGVSAAAGSGKLRTTLGSASSGTSNVPG